MKCQNCQAELNPEDQICANCGVPTVNHEMPVETQRIEQEEVITEVTETVEEKASQPTTEEIIESPVKLKKPKKNKSNAPVIILIIIIIGIIGALVYFYGEEYLNLNNEKESSYKIMNLGIEIELPSDMIYKIKDNYLLVSDDTNSWEAIIENFYTHHYQEFKNSPEYIKEKFWSLNYDVLNYQRKDYDGLSLVSFESIIEGKNILIGLLDKDQNNGLIISIIKNDNSYGYEILEKFGKILNSVIYKESYINSSNNNILINEILNKVIEEELIIDEDENNVNQIESENLDLDTQNQT